MPSPLVSAMRLFESGRLEEAAAAFAPVAGPSREGVIARFRRAEALSRLGRHDEALADARRAFEDSPQEPPASLWYAQALAEAGRFADAARVGFPVANDPEMAGIADGFAALARVASDTRKDPSGDATAILDTRHQPLFSLALRAAEKHRLATEPRWPDLPAVHYALEALIELDDAEKPAHPELGPAKGERDLGSPTRWVRLAELTGSWESLWGALRPHMFLPKNEAEARLEEDIALGRLDSAGETLATAASAAGKNADSSLCIDTTRVRQLGGAAAVPRDAPGFAAAERGLATLVHWLDIGAALLEDRPLDARPLADRLADPAHDEFVRTALCRWALPR